MNLFVQQRYSVVEIQSLWLRRFFDLQFASLWHSLNKARSHQSNPPRNILDFGGGDSPYRQLFPRNAQWSVLDPNSPQAAFHSWKGVRSEERFDLILALEVLEHLKDPAGDFLRPAALKLSTSGEIWISVPYSVRIHPCPEDWHRWTPDGLKKLLMDHQLEVLAFEHRGPFPSCLVAKMTFAVWMLLQSWKTLVFGILLLPVVCLALAAVHALVPKVRPDDLDPLGYFVRCRKKNPP